MAKDWVQNAGTVITHISEADDGTNFATPETNMYDGDFSTYAHDYNGHQGYVAHYAIMVATFTQAVRLTSIKWKCYTSADAKHNFSIWIYNGSWVNIYSEDNTNHWAGGGTGTTLTVSGDWSNVTKVEWNLYGWGNDPVAWYITQDFYEAQAWGPWGEKMAWIL